MSDRKKCSNCSTEMTIVRSIDKDGQVFAERRVCCKCGNREAVR